MRVMCGTEMQGTHLTSVSNADGEPFAGPDTNLSEDIYTMKDADSAWSTKSGFVRCRSARCQITPFSLERNMLEWQVVSHTWLNDCCHINHLG